jgi:hypothetical protein
VAHLRRFKKDAALKGRRYMSEPKAPNAKGEKQIPRAHTALGMTLAALRLGGAFSGRGISADLRGDGYSDGVGFDYGGAFGVGSLDADVVFAGGA